MIYRVPVVRARPSGRAASTHGIERQGHAAWWSSLLSFTGLIFENRLGTLAMILCFAAWMPVALAAPRHTFSLLRAEILPWLMPLLALISSLWSLEPGLTLRFSVELILFTGLAIVSASSQSLASFVSSLGCALLLGLIASVLSGDKAEIGTTGEIALIGIFGSKNNFASYVCLMLLAGSAMLGETRQTWRLRLVAIVGLVLSPVLLAKAHSLGALFTASCSVLAVVLVLVLARMAPRRRLPTLMVIGLLGGGVVLLAVLTLAAMGSDVSSLLIAMGKDPGLTGRTFLWSRARDYMAARPLLGVGFQAFWVQGHVEAEGLWQFAQIESRSGFHFHNTFYEAGVELGWVGIVLLFGTALVATVRVIRRAFWQPDGASAFLLGLFVFLAFRLTVEVDLVGSFSPGCFFLAAALVYGRESNAGGSRRHVWRGSSANTDASGVDGCEHRQGNCVHLPWMASTLRGSRRHRTLSMTR